MHRVVEAIIRTDGSVELKEPVRVAQDQRTLVVILHEPAPLVNGLRPYGLAAGQFVAPNDFNALLPDDTLAAFVGDEHA